MGKIAAIIQARHDEIIRIWKQEARHAASARGLTSPEFDNIMPVFLSGLAIGDDRFSDRQRMLVENHLSTRVRQGFDLAEIIDEFAILGRAISQTWDTGEESRPEPDEIERLFVELNAASTAAAEIFRQHMAWDEQSDKRYTRLLQEIANKALTKGGLPFRERLTEVLQLVMEAMNAQAATLLLNDGSESETMTTVAAVGDATGVFEKYVKKAEPQTFVGQVASHEEPTTLLDVLAAELRVDEVLKRNGIHSLLGVRVPTDHPMVGVLYIGLSAARPFSRRELQRIQTLAARLFLHLENAKVYDELREKIEALTVERELRERFVSVLAHDLRGPLSVAKMGAVMLVQHPERLDQRRELAVRIDVNIDRAEKMIRDLLDIHRIRANERLPLRLDDCDLAGVARLVAEELNTLYGGRFRLNEGGWVRGVWDAEELRRALWNLATNAVKYGDTDKPITITVQRSQAGAQLSVHNYGQAIPAEEQEHLFEPFARTRGARTSGKSGWGLGLTLVRGAAEAHSGKVTVESNETSGTTFTIHLPPDSRPYQAGAQAKAS